MIFVIYFRRLNLLNLGWQRLFCSTKKFENYFDTCLWPDFIPKVMVNQFLLSASQPKSRSNPKSYNICSCTEIFALKSFVGQTGIIFNLNLFNYLANKE